MEPASSLINLDFLRNFTNKDEEKLNYYIRIYIRTATKMFGDLEDRKDTISYDDLYARVHSLKPQTKYVGIAGLTELLVEIEQMLKQNSEREVVQQKLDEAIRLNKRGMADLETYLLSS